MKVALVHDYLNQMGGAERVVLALHEIFPDAPIYTSIYDPQRVDPAFQKMDIRTSFMQRLPIVFRNTTGAMRSSYHLRWRQGVLLLIQQFKWKITFLLLAALYLINVLIWRSRHVTSYNCPWSLLAGAVTRNDSKKWQALLSV